MGNIAKAVKTTIMPAQKIMAPGLVSTARMESAEIGNALSPRRRISA